jgi:hypothetical protein
MYRSPEGLQTPPARAMADINVDMLEFDDSWLTDDFFLPLEVPQVADASEESPQQKPAPPPKGKKRRSNDASQPRPKRQRLQHSHVCDLHRAPESKPSARCFGRWSTAGPYKGARCDKPVTTVIDDQLPVCSSHRNQTMKMMRCQGPLDCGLPCNEIAEWKPHGYPLCIEHWSQGKCYFLDLLPTEVRLMIYRYLSPDRPVPSRWCADRLRGDRNKVSAALFRVNKAIHDEYVHVFYGETAFQVRVANIQKGDPSTSISMCYSTVPPARLAPEKQSPLPQYDLAPWQPSLAEKYFQRIRSFHIEIVFDTLKAPAHANGAPSVESILAEADRNLICDQLHRLVDCLSANDQLPLRNLDVSVRIQGLRILDKAKANAEASAHCLKLLNPLRRLRSRTVNVVSLVRLSNMLNDVDLLPAASDEEDAAALEVRSFRAESTGSDVPSQKTPILVRFAQIAKLISKMARHQNWVDQDKEEMDILLNHARSAREKNNMKAMGTALHSTVEMLKRFNSDHQDFIKEIQQCLVEMRPDSKSQSG